MAQMVNVNFRLEDDVKRSMEEACSKLGLSMSAAFTIFAKKVGREKRIPFEVSVDPFYSKENMQYLEKKMKDYKAGKLQFEEESSRALRDKRIRQYFVKDDILSIGAVIMEKGDAKFQIYDRERMLIELLRFKNSLPFDYYKEILGNYRKHIYDLDIERIQEYASIFPKSKMISEALAAEVF